MSDDQHAAPDGTDDADDYAAKSDADVAAALEQSLNAGLTILQQAANIAQPYTPFDLELARLERNDFGNAMRLAKRFPHRIMYVEGVGWFGWVGTRRHGFWELKKGVALADQAAQETHTAIFAETKALYMAGRWPSETPQGFEKRIGGHFVWAIASGNANKLRAMLDVVRSHVTKLPDELDTDNFLFNVANGTLDLNDPLAIKLRNARPADLMTRQSPAKYDPKATCPKFEEFVQQIMPDVELRAFVQRWMGYCLTGDTSEQALALWHGGGRNGKSVLVGIMQFILGEYAKIVNFASLMRDDKKSGSGASPDLARLRGARAAIASEPENQVQFSEGLIKSLTGGETVIARHLNKEFFEYIPKFKITGLFNNKPTVRGTDFGIWRRLKMTPFTVTISDEDVDLNLSAKLRAEAAGILNWMLEGYKQWRMMGLAPPDAVVAATEEYRAESDKIGEFLRTATMATGDGTDRVEASVLFAAYHAWCKANGEYPLGQTPFGRRAGQTYQKGRSSTNGHAVYLGVKLLDEWQPRQAHTPDANDDPRADSYPDGEQMVEPIT